MTLPTLLIVGIPLVLALVGIVVFTTRYLSSLPVYVSVPLPGFTIRVTGATNPPSVANALLLAMEATTLIWDRDHVRAVIDANDLHIKVMPTESWLNEGGIKVGGEQAKNILVVGPSLSALCHELMHFLQWKLDGFDDALHAGWGTLFWAADESYRAQARIARQYEGPAT